MIGKCDLNFLLKMINCKRNAKCIAISLEKCVIYIHKNNNNSNNNNNNFYTHHRVSETE